MGKSSIVRAVFMGIRLRAILRFLRLSPGPFKDWRRRGRADLRDGLLGGIDAEAGDLGETLHRIVVGGVSRRAGCGHLQ